MKRATVFLKGFDDENLYRQVKARLLFHGINFSDWVINRMLEVQQDDKILLKQVRGPSSLHEK